MNKILLFFTICLLVLSSCTSNGRSNVQDSKQIPTYAVSDKQEYPGLQKISYEIEIPEAYSEEQIKAIMYDLPNPNGRNVFATYRIAGMPKEGLAYAGGQILNGQYSLSVYMDFTEYEEDEHPGCTIIGQWIVYGSDTYVIYEKEGKYYGVFASKGKWGEEPDELKKYQQNGYDTFENKVSNESKEFMEVHPDGLHIDSRKEPGEVIWGNR